LKDEHAITQVESWTTGEEYCRDTLKSRGLEANELDGWTVTLHDDNDWYELMGNDYVLDLISEMEVPPAFPVCKSFFLVSTDLTNDGNQQQKRRSMTAGSNNPDSVYDWYFEMHQTANSTDRMVLTKAIKGNSSNNNLENISAPVVNNKNIKQPVQNASASTKTKNKTNKEPAKPILKHENIASSKKLPTVPKNDKPTENKSKSNIVLSADKKSVRHTNNIDINNKSLGKKRLSKPKVSNILASDSKTRMYTLNKSKKGTLCNSRKQNFRFRFEPNKSTLTKIVMKDSLKSRSAFPSTTPTPLIELTGKKYSNSGYLFVDDKIGHKNVPEKPKEKKDLSSKVGKHFDDRAYRSVGNEVKFKQLI
jgi:hypothetical protein